MSGGFPPRDFSDAKITCNSILNWIKSKKRIITDDDYVGSWKLICKKAGRKNNRALRNILARHDNINLKFKKFKVLSEWWEGDLEFHPIVSHTVFNLVQLSLDLGCDILPSIRF